MEVIILNNYGNGNAIVQNYPELKVKPGDKNELMWFRSSHFSWFKFQLINYCYLPYSDRHLGIKIISTWDLKGPKNDPNKATKCSVLDS